jgi:hypothetical protein
MADTPLGFLNAKKSQEKPFVGIFCERVQFNL